MEGRQAGAIKLAAVVLLLVVLLLVVLYAVALAAVVLWELVPWPWNAVLAVVMAAAVWRALNWHLIDDPQAGQLRDDPVQIRRDSPVQIRRRILVAAVIVVAVGWIAVNFQN